MFSTRKVIIILTELEIDEMNIEFVPLLKLQRELYDIPLGPERFRTYIQTMTDDQGEMELPLSAMNPMAKPHVPALIDEVLALQVEDLATVWLRDVQAEISGQSSRSFRVAFVVADDLMGGWTDRTSTEFKARFQTKPMHRRGWLVAHIWSSETAELESLKNEFLTTIYRGLAIETHGYAETLKEMLYQEGFAMRQAGSIGPSLPEDELEYAFEVIRPLFDSIDYPQQVAALFGDEAADSLGYASLGLPSRAGYAVANRYFNRLS